MPRPTRAQRLQIARARRTTTEIAAQRPSDAATAAARNSDVAVAEARRVVESIRDLPEPIAPPPMTFTDRMATPRRRNTPRIRRGPAVPVVPWGTDTPAPEYPTLAHLAERNGAVSFVNTRDGDPGTPSMTSHGLQSVAARLLRGESLDTAPPSRRPGWNTPSRLPAMRAYDFDDLVVCDAPAVPSGTPPRAPSQDTRTPDERDEDAACLRDLANEVAGPVRSEYWRDMPERIRRAQFRANDFDGCTMAERDAAQDEVTVWEQGRKLRDLRAAVQGFLDWAAQPAIEQSIVLDNFFRRQVDFAKRIIGGVT